MPVSPSDFSSYSPSEQALILEHIARPALYLVPLLVATLLDACLLGLILTASWSYVKWFSDTWKFRGVVIALVVLNLAQTSIASYTLLSMFGTGFGDWAGTTTNVYFEGILIIEAITGSVAQAFFLERAYTLLRKRRFASYVLLGVCIPGILAGLALGLASGGITVLSSAGSGTNFSNFNALTDLIIGWKSTTVLTDFILTGAIVFCLLNSRTGWRQTDSAVTRLVRWIVEAQALPLLAALFFLISYAVDSGGNVCLIPSFAEAKLACISVLHVLNSRGRLRHDLSTEHTSGKHSGGAELTTKGRIQIQIHTITKNSAPDEYELESQSHRHPRGTQTRGNRPEEDDISLESFEEGKEGARMSSPSRSTSVMTASTTGDGQGEGGDEEARNQDMGSQAKLVPFEHVRW